MKKQRRTQLNILGVRVDFLTMEEALYWVEEQVKYNKVGQITTPNPEQVILVQEDKEFLQVLNKADLNICDGIGLLWAAKYLLFCSSAKDLRLKRKGAHDCFSESSLRDSVVKGDCKVLDPRMNISSKDHFASFGRNDENKVGRAYCNNVKGGAISRLSGVDLMLEMCKLAVRKGWKVMLVGGKKGVAKKTAERLEKSFCHCKDSVKPETKQSLNQNNKKIDCFTSVCNNNQHCFKVIGIDGSKNIENETRKEKEEIVKKINNYKPNLLFVAYGAPWQEKWISKNLPKLKVNAAMGVGGAFDYISGKVRRAPRFVGKIGLEWLWRLTREPWRVKRQLNLLKFIWLVANN